MNNNKIEYIPLFQIFIKKFNLAKKLPIIIIL